MPLTLSVPMEYCKVLDTKLLPINGSGNSQRRALLPFSFPRQAVRCCKKLKNQSLHSAQQHVFQVIRTGMNVLNSLFLLFYFDIKITVMVLAHENPSRPSVSENISQLAALQSSCAFTTLLQIRSQDDGIIWVFGMGEPGCESNCYSELVKTR